MSIDMEQALERVNEYLSQVDDLLTKSYREGREKSSELDSTVKNFVRIAFPDGDEKLADYRRSAPIYVGILGREDTEEEKQDYYLRKLRAIRNNLIAYQQELQLRLSSRRKSSKLDEIEERTRTSEAEAKRRAAVVETKLWGAVIEMIDMQRDELKKRSELTQGIIELRKEITELKTILVDFIGKIESEEG